MASKRKSDREGDDRNPEIPVQQSKRRHGDSEVQIPIRVIGNLRIAVTLRELVPSIGGLVGRLFREEIQRHSQTVHHIGTSGPKPIYELRFANKVACTIYTRSLIKSEEDKFIQIELINSRSQSVITVGDLAFKKITLCVLKGEFGSEDWTADQFAANILRPREGREPLLKGGIHNIRLQSGVATIKNLEFTDNSHWTRNGKFRLEAKVAGSTPLEEDIREGISEPFKVKEIRVKDKKKHDRQSSRSVAGQEAGQCSGTDQDLQLNYPTAHQGFGGMTQHGSAGGELLAYNIEDNYWPSIGSEFPVVPNSYSTWVPTGDGVYFDPCNGAEFGIHSSFHNSCMDMSSSEKTRTVLWCKMKNAFKWVISVRREAAAKRRMRGKAALP